MLKRFTFFSRPAARLVGCVCLLSIVSIEAVRAAASSEAYVGQPFGVGRVTVDVLRGEPLLPLSDERFTVLEASGRAIYPVLKQEPVRKFLRGLLKMDAPRKVTIYYLFIGDDPFDLSSFTPHEQGIRVTPLRDPAGHRSLLNQWWQQYTKHYETLLKDRAYPPVAENFLIASLSRRLNLPLPEPRHGLLGGGEKQDGIMSDLFVNETHSLRVDRQLVHEEPSRAAEMVALPEPIDWPASDSGGDELDEVEIEPLATHVPEECFYVRFGSFTNYFWFRDLNKKWQGDLGNMILQRGIKRGASERIQQQLSLRENALAKVLGPQVIDDAGLIGLDPYVQQGAAIGILFQGKNDFLLSTDMMTQRRLSLTKFDDAKEETVEIEGQSVSYIGTPNGEVRTYYVQHEGFHLVTTSRTLVARFLQAGQGKGSLANLPSFRRARQRFALERNDTMFAFVSEKFWQNLCSPYYVVENSRRVRSTRESLLLNLAGYAAQCESQLAGVAGELNATQILPPNFAARVDGSQLAQVDEEFIDSLRGARGYYLPIADVEVGEVSQQEAEHYRQLRSKLQTSPGALPPIAAAVRHHSNENGDPETITVDVEAQGVSRQQLGKIGAWLGQPASNKLRSVEGDVLAVESVVDFPASLAAEDGSEHHIFGALRDFRSPLVVQRGSIRPDAPPAELVRGYLGAWPRPGLLQWLTGAEAPVGPEPEPVDGGFGEVLVDQMWQAKQEDYLLLSFKPDVIQQVLPQLNVEPAERPAQLWVSLQELTGTELAESASALGYMRTRETSAAGSRMMNSLANQLQVPRAQCREVAERLIDGAFVCPLGGEYELYAPRRGLEVWISSALPAENRFLLSEVPDDFRLPLLDWFRGLSGDVCLDEQSLSLHLEVKMTKAALP